MEYADGEEESLFDRFGFRTLSTDGKNVLLNGVPFYVRGYIRGAKAHEHSDNCKLGKRGVLSQKRGAGEKIRV